MHTNKEHCRFQWVSLQLDYIYTLHRSIIIQKRLGRLPQGLSHSYKDVFDQNLEDYKPEDCKRLDIALSLLLLPIRPENPSVLTKLIFWDNGEDDENGSSNEDNEDEIDEGDSDDGIIEEGTEDIETDDNNEDGVASVDDGPNDEETNEGTEFAQIAGHRIRNEESPTSRYYEIIRLCFNLVIFDSTTQMLRFAHTSAQDYLQNYNTRNKDLSECHARLADRYILILLNTF